MVNIDDEASQYATSFGPILRTYSFLDPYIFLGILFLKTPSLCILPLILESKFDIHIKRHVKLHLCVLKFMSADSKRKEEF